MRKTVLAAMAVAPLLVLCGGAAFADVPIVPQVPVTGLVSQLSDLTNVGSPVNQAVAAAATTTSAMPTSTVVPTTIPVVVPVEQPSIAQICVATGVDQVDDLLGKVSDSRLVGDLKPLVGIAVPQSDHVTLVDAVQLSDVRKRLNCPDADSTAKPTATATAKPTETTAPSTTFASCEAVQKAKIETPILMGSAHYQADLDSDHDGVACEGNDFASADTSPLTGGVNTGDGSA